jgi:hypothetical protein
MNLDFLNRSSKNIKYKILWKSVSGSRVAPCGKTGRQTEMTKVIVTFRNFAIAPKNVTLFAVERSRDIHISDKLFFRSASTRFRVMASPFGPSQSHSVDSSGRTISPTQRTLPDNTPIHNRQTSIPVSGFEPTVSTGERPHTGTLDRAATGIGRITCNWPQSVLCVQTTLEIWVKIRY